jgi:hypothetical protein
MTIPHIKNVFYVTLLLLLLIPGYASAHQPRIVESRETIVIEPEISKAYYGQLTGVPDVFIIETTTPFNLYANILVPDIAGQKKDISATIVRDGKPFTVLDGTQFQWTQMFEQFGYDRYWTGPEYTNRVEAGTYIITVTSANNDSKYSLAIGEAENFNFKEILNALTLVPKLKTDFFNESPISFILSPFGWGLILVLYVLAGLFAFAYRFVLRKVARNTVRGASRNIGVTDRLIRLFIAVALLIWAITTTWNIFIIFLSGFALFEAIFSWCGFYAAIGKNTCPVE